MGIRHSVNNIEQIIKDLSLENVSDMVADIMHYCDHKGMSFDEVLRLGNEYYKADIIEEDDYEAEDEPNSGFAR